WGWVTALVAAIVHRVAAGPAAPSGAHGAGHPAPAYPPQPAYPQQQYPGPHPGQPQPPTAG
ncbi:MAG: hypothetical protein IJG47_11275, partial [Microbacterium sp.]|nr:hypothetical protein [Microbacterium sp.]